MGKETKIGLAVVSVLLVVFGALLFRKLTILERSALAPDEPLVSTPPSSAENADKPHVVPQDHAGQGGFEPSNEPAWTRAGSDGDPQRADAPRAVYMPDEAAPVAAARDDRYASRPSRQEASEAGATAEPASNPFHRRGAEASKLEAQTDGQPAAESARELNETPREPSAMRSGERPLRRRNNPVRQASATEPIEEPITEPDDRRLPALTTSELAGELPSAAEPAADSPVDEPHVRFDGDSGDGARVGAEPVETSAPLSAAADEGLSEPPADEPVARQAAVPAQWQSDDAAATSPRTAVEAELPANGKYTVQPNENLWTISEKFYGTGRYFKALAEHNRSKLPRSDKLAVGTVVSVPSTSLLEQNYPSLCPKQRKSALVRSRDAAGQHAASRRPRRQRVHRRGRRHAVRHRPLRVGQGLAVERDLRSQSRRARRGL